VLKQEAKLGVSSSAIKISGQTQSPWLRSRDWDLRWITLSVVMVAGPYLAYLGLLSLLPIVQPLADLLNADVGSISRNLVNGTVALLVGGPHMYATYTRTVLDRGFSTKHRRLLWSSLLIPLVVIFLAFYNLVLLLTVFFFWASIHVLHQIIFIIDLYRQKQPTELPLLYRLADYGVIMTALYPLAAWKVANGKFTIGVNNLSEMVGAIVPLGPWMVWLAGGAFGIALTVWVVKSVVEWRQGTLHVPKTLFIALTVTASFFVPALGNLDTAFQGMNVWHSFQYLALTWLLNNIRNRRGELEKSPFVKRLSTNGSARRYYMFNIGLTAADVLLAVVLFAVLHFVIGLDFDYAFDRAYYVAVLSFLWIHYYHDHFLFTQPEVIGARQSPVGTAP
jgi:hypothetical protein